MPLRGEEFAGPIPKPEPCRRVKGRKARAAGRVVQSVRQQCVERDGHCRLSRWPSNDRLFNNLTNTCVGRSEWAHLGEKRRFKTRGQAPEVRHSTAGSLMLCTKHHQDYDQGRLAIEGNDANAPLSFIRTR